MRMLLSVCVLAAVAIPLAACGGGSSKSSSSKEALERKADLYDIDQIERNWHKSISRHDIKLMMSLWAPNATFTPIPGKTLTGKQQIRDFWVKVAYVTDPKNHWLLDTPAYKLRESVNGDKGTLYFECDHIDLKTGKVFAVTAANQQVARIGGRWVITNAVGGSPELSS
jgi:hypothetical protein